MPYDELVKRLKNCATQAAPCKTCDLIEDGSCSDTLMKQAADAIEELLAERDEVNADSWKTAFEVERDEHRWIPVTEAMPESGVCVLVTDGLEVGEGWLTEITNTLGHFMWWCVPMTDIDVDRRPITHWMPMPKAPREGE